MNPLAFKIFHFVFYRHFTSGGAIAPSKRFVCLDYLLTMPRLFRLRE